MRRMSTVATYPKRATYVATVQPGQPMYAHHGTMPMLPVPSLEETRERYLGTVRPLVSDADEWQATEQRVRAFFGSERARELDARLRRRAAEKAVEGKSWLIDWWNDWAYFAYRDPVVINVSYFFHFADDKKRSSPFARAASLVTGAMRFRHLVTTQQLSPDVAGKEKAPLCMRQYQFMFNTCRIPLIPSDDIQTYDPSKYNHISVMRKGWCYALPMHYPGTQTLLSAADLERALAVIVKQADQLGWNPNPLGVMTSENRDTWAKAREHLWKASSVNQTSLESIESSALMLCLDDTKPLTREEVGRALWHGDGRNRWFDKTLQFIVFENGKAGFLGEHALMDATPNHRMCEYILDGLAKNKIDLGSASAGALPEPVPLTFQLPENFSTYLTSAANRFDVDVARNDHAVLAYEGYGKELIKTFGLSPDAYAQLAMQLAYYKLFGECRATYESAQTKKYAWGRTETCRTVSTASVAWVKAMQDPSIPAAQKAALGRTAVQSHSEYMAAAVNGHGVDRHILGLRLSVRPGEQPPAIISDPSFSTSCHWYLSTSQITSEYFDGWGWGQVVPDGYGIAYMIKDASFHFNIAALHGGPGYEHGPGSWRGKGRGIVNPCAKMRHALQESLADMRRVFEQKEKVKAKL